MSGWATPWIAMLLEGRVATFRPHGNSMVPIIHSGNLVEVTPCWRDPEPDDVVRCRVQGTVYLHKVTAVQGGRYQISNNKGHVNGWTSRDKVFGILTKVSP